MAITGKWHGCHFKYEVDTGGKLAEFIPVLLLLYEEGSTPKYCVLETKNIGSSEKKWWEPIFLFLAKSLGF